MGTSKSNGIKKTHLAVGKGKPLSDVERNAFFKSFIEEGSTVNGDRDGPHLLEDIPWLDRNLLEKGREFVERNYVVVLMTMMAADTVGFISKQIASPVFKNFYPVNSCPMRFLSTFNTTMNGWLLSGFDDHFFKEIQRVRKMHKIFANPKVKPIIPPDGLQLPVDYSVLVKLIKEDLKNVDTSNYPSNLISWHPEKYFTQFDVALVQFGMFAPFLIYPNKLGLYTTFEDDEGLRGYFHMWAVIGRMIGLEDRFNLALYPDRNLYMDIVNNLGLPSLKMVDETVLYSIDKMVDGLFNTTIPYMVTMKSLLVSSVEAGGRSLERVKASMSWHDKFSYHWFKIMVYLMKFDAIRSVSNLLAKGMLNGYIKMFLKVSNKV